MQKIDSQMKKDAHNAGDFDWCTGGNPNKIKKRIWSKNRRRFVKKMTEKTLNNLD